MTVVSSNKVNGKPVFKDNDFVSYFKEIENIAYMEGIRHSDVVRLRGDIELCFLGEFWRKRMGQSCLRMRMLC